MIDDAMYKVFIPKRYYNFFLILWTLSITIVYYSDFLLYYNSIFSMHFIYKYYHFIVRVSMIHAYQVQNLPVFHA